MLVFLCVIIAILLLVIAVLMAMLGYLAGKDKASEVIPMEAAILTFLAHYNGTKDPDEPEVDPDPKNVESAENGE